MNGAELWLCYLRTSLRNRRNVDMAEWTKSPCEGRGFLGGGSNPLSTHFSTLGFCYTVAFYSDNALMAGAPHGYCSIVVSTSRCGRDILGSTPGSSINFSRDEYFCALIRTPELATIPLWKHLQTIARASSNLVAVDRRIFAISRHLDDLEPQNQKRVENGGPRRESNPWPLPP